MFQSPQHEDHIALTLVAIGKGSVMDVDRAWASSPADEDPESAVETGCNRGHPALCRGWHPKLPGQEGGTAPFSQRTRDARGLSLVDSFLGQAVLFQGEAMADGAVLASSLPISGLSVV